MDIKQKLESMIDEAWNDYVELHKAEIESGYDDAMDGFERKEAEGYAMGLQNAYFIVYGENYETKTPHFDEDNYSEWLD